MLGSCERMAMRADAGRVRRKRKTNSSMSVVLPAPPGPVMPTTRQVCIGAAADD